MTGIYKITNNLNGKVYIGQSTDVEQRLLQHKTSLMNSNTAWYPLARKESNSIKDFSFEALQECKLYELDELEEYWINYYDSVKNGYNLREIKHQNGYFTIEVDITKEELLKMIKNAYKNKWRSSAIAMLFFFYENCDNKKFLLNKSIFCKDYGFEKTAYHEAFRCLKIFGVLTVDERDNMSYRLHPILKK